MLPSPEHDVLHRSMLTELSLLASLGQQPGLVGTAPPTPSYLLQVSLLGLYEEGGGGLVVLEQGQGSLKAWLLGSRRPGEGGRLASVREEVREQC